MATRNGNGSTNGHNKGRRTKSRGFITYKTYLFRTKDPVIDELRTLKSDLDLKDKKIAEESGVSPGTIGKWWHGKTRRPQNASIEAVGRAMGKKRKWVDM